MCTLCVCVCWLAVKTLWRQFSAETSASGDSLTWSVGVIRHGDVRSWHCDIRDVVNVMVVLHVSPWYSVFFTVLCGSLLTVASGVGVLKACAFSFFLAQLLQRGGTDLPVSCFFITLSIFPLAHIFSAVWILFFPFTHISHIPLNYSP